MPDGEKSFLYPGAYRLDEREMDALSEVFVRCGEPHCPVCEFVLLRTGETERRLDEEEVADE